MSAWCFGCWRAITARYGAERYHNRPGGLLVHDRADGALQVGRRRLDHGPDQFEVGCPTCEATWLDSLGASCPWCIARLEATVAGQRQILLCAPEADPEDSRYAEVVSRWADRLQRGVETGLISDDEADGAWSRALAVAA